MSFPDFGFCNEAAKLMASYANCQVKKLTFYLVWVGSNVSLSNCYCRIILILFYRFSSKKKKKVGGVVCLWDKNQKIIFSFFLSLKIINYV